MFFFFNDTATTEIYTLSLHDALPISGSARVENGTYENFASGAILRELSLRASGAQDRLELSLTAVDGDGGDRKSTRLNSSHANISYAVFFLQKNTIYPRPPQQQGLPR